VDSSDQAEAFRTLFEANYSYVCRSLRRLGIAGRDLDDVAQDLFVTVYRKLPERPTNRPMRAWLMAFAYRLAANYHRLARHREMPAAGDDLVRHAPVTHLEDHAAQDVVLRALQAVKLERRPVLIMHEIDGFSAPEIAASLEVPLNTVYSRLRLARREFRRAVEAMYEEVASA